MVIGDWCILNMIKTCSNWSIQDIVIKKEETIAVQNHLIILSFNDKEALPYTNHDEWYFSLCWIEWLRTV